MKANQNIEFLLKRYSIDKSLSIQSALRKMDESKTKLLIILQDEKYFSLLSIGDIQRALIRNIDIQRDISEILRPKSKIKIAKKGDTIQSIKNLMLEHRIEFMPKVDKDSNIIEILFWKDLFDFEKKIEQKLKNIPVVIMAGGTGTRLKPLTNVIPKPLLPIGDKPILTKIMETFKISGSKSFFLSVNYMHEMIRTYYKVNCDPEINLEYIMEEKPLGTAGSISLLKDKLKSTFFVSNCDIIIDQDYGDVLEYHRLNGNKITIVAALKHYSIPYGTLEISKGGILNKISEKPDLNYIINTGVYIIEPEVIAQIPENEFFHITHLIEKVKKNNMKVGVFPVSEKSWIDIGEWGTYIKLIGSSINI